ncbi:MAG: hypothetical protein KC493_11875 [Bacteriovoracaceae bacterium]|nr:hypothetical protein [Bacteriovoracaceae bacterium]
MKTVFMIALSLFLVSCGSDNSNTQPGQVIPFETADINEFLNQLSTDSEKLKTGQKKIYREDSYYKLSADVYCDYWTTFTEEITNEVLRLEPRFDAVEVQITKTSKLFNDQPIGCPNSNHEDGVSTSLKTRENFKDNRLLEIKSFVDHEYRCKVNERGCLNSSLVSVTDGALGEIPVRKVITRYNKRSRDGHNYTKQIEVYVSKRSLFEGVLKIEAKNVKTNGLFYVRDFIFSTF